MMSEYSHRSMRKRPRDDYDEFPRSKKGRYSDPGPRAREPESTQQKLESLISRLGEKSHKSLESNLDALATLLINEMAVMKDHILHTICKCVVSSTEKAPIYSALVGLLNAKKFEVGEQILDLVMGELRSALALGCYDTAQHLVLFLADLANCKVVNINSIVTLFDTFVTVTFEPDIPQTRSDCFVNMLLTALPIIGAELEERKRQEFERLLATLDNYMSKRVCPFLPMFQVWSSEHPHPQRDELTLLWTQVRACRDSSWESKFLLKLHSSFQSEFSGAYTHPLPSVQVPAHSADSLYPLPKAVFRLFSTSDIQYSAGSTLPAADSIDRFLAELSVHSILSSHQSNRKDCAAALVRFAESSLEHLQLAADYIIVEVLFGRMLQLPQPPQVLVYYSSMLIEMCKSNPAVYPQLLSQTTELLFSRLETMNTVAIDRFAIWFAHHLSNFKYQWDWGKWSEVTEDSPAGKFLSEVFTKCVRLACFDEFSELVPLELKALLPPEPMPCYQYSKSDGSVEADTAAKLLEAIKNKESMDNLKTILQSLNEVSEGHQTVDQSRMAVLTQCVLKVGCKTITHCFLALVKFRELFIELADEEGCKAACLQALGQFYANNTQVQSLVIEKLLRMSVLDGVCVVDWLFSDHVAPRFIQSTSWTVLHSTLDKSRNSLLQANAELKKTKDRLNQVSQLDEVALGGNQREELQSRVAELEERSEDSEHQLRNVLVTVFERLVGCLSSELERGTSMWTRCTLDNCRQLLVKNHGELRQLSALLEDTVFTADIHPFLLEVFQQFQALL